MCKLVCCHVWNDSKWMIRTDSFFFKTCRGYGTRRLKLETTAFYPNLNRHEHTIWNQSFYRSVLHLTGMRDARHWGFRCWCSPQFVDWHAFGGTLRRRRSHLPFAAVADDAAWTPTDASGGTSTGLVTWAIHNPPGGVLVQREFN